MSKMTLVFTMSIKKANRKKQLDGKFQRQQYDPAKLDFGNERYYLSSVAAKSRGAGLGGSSSWPAAFVEGSHRTVSTWGQHAGQGSSAW